MHYGARFYSPRLGRFISADTVVPEPGEPQALNRYAYATNNPLRFVDPTGHGGPGDWLTGQLITLGRSGDAGRALVVSAAEAIHHVNWQTQKVFYPDPNTSTVDRFWACVEIGGGSVVVAAAATELAFGTLTTAAVSGGTTTVATTAGTATTAACADGDCTNEIKTATSTSEWINKEIAQGGNVLQRWGPQTGSGPLPEKIANTFRSASYSEVKLTEEITLYRSYGGKASELGSFWTRTQPTGPMQAQMDGAILSEWGNTMTQVAQIRVPAGTIIYEGYAAEQAGIVIKLLGGGSQVYIPYVDPSWLVK